ncbi:MAG: hypothetical protein RBT59_03150 [Arcobacteraceae bacterium]|jgi:hypothetical protein|nr:hypothetical protein [Arcobacteraceae bacterium]
MSLVNDKLFDINSIKPKEIDETIDKLHKDFNGKTIVKNICPACGSEQYSFAFDKYKFHYVECCKCKSLYVQNSITMEDYKKYAQELEKIIYTSEKYQNYLNELSNNNHFNLELTLSRFLNKNSLVNVAYMGNKAKVFQIALGGFNTVFEIITEASEIQKKYDLIILDHYFEKSVDLSNLMKIITQSLNKNGYLYISSRVGSGIDILTLWEDTKLYPFEHQNLMSIDGIKIMLTDNGFNIKELNTPGTLDVDNILNSESSNIPKFLKYLSSFNKENALEDFRIFIQKNLLSSFATVIAQKG